MESRQIESGSQKERRGLDLEVKHGRIVYRDFTLRFPHPFEVRFFASASLDESLDLTGSVSVRPRLYERLRVSGSSAQSALELVSRRVDIPIVGTSEQLVLDLARIDRNALLGDAMKSSAEETIGGMLKALSIDKKNRDRKPKRRTD